MLTYLTSKGLSDAQIQLISGHESKNSLEVYQHLSLESVDKAYQDAVQSVGALKNADDLQRLGIGQVNHHVLPPHRPKQDGFVRQVRTSVAKARIFREQLACCINILF